VAVGTLETEAQLESFVKSVLDRLGLGQPDSGVADKSVTLAKLAVPVLQAVAAAAGFKFNVGTGTITWPGASASSNSLALPHGLGGTPAGYIGFINGTSGVGSAMLDGTAKDGTNITFQAFTPSFQPPNTATTPISWLAWI
jgi:hypothetical protein